MLSDATLRKTQINNPETNSTQTANLPFSRFYVKSPEVIGFGIFPEIDSLGFFHPKVNYFTRIKPKIF